MNEIFEEAPKFVPSDKRKVSFKGSSAMEYEIFNVVDEYSFILKQKAILWDFTNPPGNLHYIVISMIQTMIKQGGIGLAANQCGLRYKIFVMGTGQYIEPIINPEIISLEGEELDQEGCLSYPGLFMKIKRATRVVVRYFDLNGIQKEQTFDGLTARIFQHEFDHLNGIKFVERVSKITHMQAKQKVKTNLKKIKKFKEAALKLEAQTKSENQLFKKQDQPDLIITENKNEASMQPVSSDKLVLEIPNVPLST